MSINRRDSLRECNGNLRGWADRIEAEVRENEALWGSFRGKLPGLFISRVPLARLKRSDDGCIYVSFKNTHPKVAADVVDEIRRLVDDTLSWDFAQRRVPPGESLAGAFFDAIEIKPGIFGFKIDLKKLAGRWIKAA
jgi:hypothetical protein